MKKTANKEQKYLLSPINNKVLNYAVYIPSFQEKLLFKLLFLIIGGCVGLIFFSGFFKSDGEATIATYISDVVFFMIVGLIAVKFLFPSVIASKLKKRSNILKNQFRDMLDSLSASLSSGSNPPEAFNSAYIDICQQYGSSSFMAKELEEIIAGTQQNKSITEMLLSFAQRSGNEDIESFANMFEICLQKGASLKTVVRRTHAIISEKMAVHDEIETKLASNKMQHSVMCIMPIGIVAMLRFTNDSFAESFATPIGVIANLVAIGVFIGSYILGKKITDIK